jgi:zinc protease
MTFWRKVILASCTAFLLSVSLPAGAVEVQKVTSPGGIMALLVEDHLNPIISVRFAFRGGAALDPIGKEGLANMVSSLLDEGAGELDSQGFQRALEDLSMTLRFNAGRDAFGGRLRTLSTHRGEAFELLRLSLTAPRFDEQPVARIRRQILSALRRKSENPGNIARRTLLENLFPGHPYGRPTDGTEDSVAAVTTQDLKGFVGARLSRGNLVIGVVGDITPQELSAILDKTFGGLPEKAEAWSVPEVRPQGLGRTIVIRKPVPQSSIIFAQEGLKRNDPDFYTAYVMNYVLGGGGFTSRLYDEVREKRGLAYSVYSALSPLDHSALIMGGAGTANARVSETLEVIREQWRLLAEKGVTESELADAKTYLTGSFPLRFTSSRRIAGMLVGMQLDNLGIDYFERRNSYIEAVSLDGVNRLARRLLDSDKLLTVVVGEPAKVKTTN